MMHAIMAFAQSIISRELGLEMPSHHFLSLSDSTKTLTRKKASFDTLVISRIDFRHHH